ncbi:branched-chain amino acid ABC transporter permease [Bosea sp. 685]|uniref:branched-chain amino acid ABC transporter permease n=1 Tax=Bosea sp. 685 TaxID=3080057 RepID=UPI002893760B|nr:branched-chain amino acid ABC transporter permease [Bosea sp. 685]WNJ88019.1 branched-chain amino acid ABC transporter permease [Bosea sp. 685]
MAELLQYLATGITIGAVYALVALGFTLIYNCSGIVNFAQGEFVMIGGMVTVALTAYGLPLEAAAAGAVAVAIMVGIAIYVFAVAPAGRASPVTIIIITIGVSIFLRGCAQILFGKQFHGLKPFLTEEPVMIMGAAVQSQAFLVIGGMAAASLVFWLMLERTLVGKALLATAANRLAAQLVGIDLRRIMLIAFGGSAAIGAIAGILVTPITLTSYDVGTMLALKGFAAAMLGGMGSPLGAVAGGLLLGLAEALAAGYLSSAYKDAIAFLATFAVLLLAPNGLLGRRSINRV